jgi:HPt (histidine-containing phosphotransfer) domain-containing protein
LILLDLNEHSPELIAHLKTSNGINNKTPLIAIINQKDEAQWKHQHPSDFDDWLLKPFTKEQLENSIDLWQTKKLALDYIQIIQAKTKNNQRLTLTIFEKLFEELPLQLANINEALKNKQYTLAQEITHKLNGSASFCGLQDIQQPANTLETSLLNLNYADINKQFQTLQQCTLHFTCLQQAIMTTLRNITTARV